MSFARLILSFHVKCGRETSNVGLWMCNFKAEQKNLRYWLLKIKMGKAKHGKVKYELNKSTNYRKTIV